ncbi:DUF4158 domain-containing protein [Candidatus Poribacteria bacterium]|nr:DUF4158 domain-containing protein [Candidatus Poribacteria bacterium]
MRIKLFEHLLRNNFALSDVSPKVIDYIASQLGVAKRELSETRGQRYEQIQICRQFWGFSPFSDAETKTLEAWLVTQAVKQFHLMDLVNEAVFHLSEMRVELPTFERLVRFAAAAQTEADRRQKELLNQSLSAELRAQLDALLLSELRYQRTPFYELKEPPSIPSASAIQKEVHLLKRLRAFNISFDVLQQMSREKIKHFFEIAKSYKSNELADLLPETRHPMSQAAPKTKWLMASLVSVAMRNTNRFFRWFAD